MRDQPIRTEIILLGTPRIRAVSLRGVLRRAWNVFFVRCVALHLESIPCAVCMHAVYYYPDWNY